MLEGLYLSSKNCYHLSQLFASYPLTYSAGNGFTKSNVGLIYCYICLLLSIAHLLLTPYYLHSVSVDGNSTSESFDDLSPSTKTNYDPKKVASDPDIQSTVIRYINPILILSMSITAKYVSIYLVPKLVLNMQFTLDGIDLLLSFLTRKNFRSVDHSKYLVFVWTIASVPVNLLYLYFGFLDLKLWDIVWSFFMVFNNLSAFASEIQFSNYCWMIRSRYKIINDYFGCYKRDWPDPATVERLVKQSVSNGNYYKLSSDLFKVGYPVKSNQISALWQRNDERLKLILYLSHLSVKKLPEPSADLTEVALSCHASLTDLVQQINKAYQLQILSSLFSCFLKLLFNIYFSVFSNNVTELQSITMILGTTGKTVLWSLFYLLRFLCLVISASLMSKEANLTKTQVTFIKQSQKLRDINKQISRFIKAGSFQWVYITAYGLFDLSPRLITSAVAAGATYIVILVQFHASDCSKKN